MQNLDQIHIHGKSIIIPEKIAQTRRPQTFPLTPQNIFKINAGHDDSLLDSAFIKKRDQYKAVLNHNSIVLDP